MSEEIKEAIMQFKTAINFKTATVMPMEYSIDIENAKVLLKYIEQLQQENKELKHTILNYQLHTEIQPNSHESINGNELICNLFTENKNIKNILTEFEKWLEEEIEKRKGANNPLDSFQTDSFYIKLAAKTCLDKLKELKEGKE